MQSTDPPRGVDGRVRRRRSVRLTEFVTPACETRGRHGLRPLRRSARAARRARASCSTTSRRRRGSARTPRPTPRSTARSGAAMVDQGWLGVEVAEDRRWARARLGRGRGAGRGARPPRRARAVRADGARARRASRAPATTPGSSGCSTGDAIACVAWDPAAPVPYAPSADVAVVLADDGVYAMELDRAAARASRRWTSPASSAGCRSIRATARRLGDADARDAAARSRRDVHERRSARQRVARARPGGRVREGPRAVRPADRLVPGGEAPLRRHARRRRGHALDGLLGGVVHRRRRCRRVGRGVDREDLVRATRRSG